MTKKRCEECNSLYQPQYYKLNKKGKQVLDMRVCKMSTLCPECVKKICLDYEQKQQQALDYYNYGNFIKNGYNYVPAWILLPENQYLKR